MDIAKYADYFHDSLYNRTQKDGRRNEINDLNELLTSQNSHYSYDRNGNQVFRQTPVDASHFVFDPLNRLIEIGSEQKKIKFSYDPLGRCLGKIVYAKEGYDRRSTTRENYLYHGQHEIGAFTAQNKPINLRLMHGCPIAQMNY